MNEMSKKKERIKWKNKTKKRDWVLWLSWERERRDTTHLPVFDRVFFLYIYVYSTVPFELYRNSLKVYR